MSEQIERLARPSSSVPRRTDHGGEPTRLEILKTKKGRPFAGELDDLSTEFSVTRGIVNYTGHLPGLHSPIGTSYPNLVKKSAMYLEEKGKPGWGGPRVPVDDAQHDKWGSLKPLPERLKKDIANLYLSASNPSAPIDPSVGVGYSPARRTEPPSDVTLKFFPHTCTPEEQSLSRGRTRHHPEQESSASPSRTPARFGNSYRPQSPTLGINNEGRSTSSLSGSIARSPSRAMGASSAFGFAQATSSTPLIPSTRVVAEEPRHVAGYKGHIPGTRHMYGENFNRIDRRARINDETHGHGGKGLTAAATAVSPSRIFGEYETQNLIVANRNAVPH